MKAAGQQLDNLYYGRTQEQWAKMLTVAKAYLEECARGNSETTYEALNHRFERDRLPWFRFEEDESAPAAVGKLLGQISVESYERDQIMLSALVRNSGGKTVGAGFWTLAAELGEIDGELSPRQKSGELKRLTKAVMAHYRQPR